jgi:hypothetical protein
MLEFLHLNKSEKDKVFFSAKETASHRRGINQGGMISGYQLLKSIIKKH